MALSHYEAPWWDGHENLPLPVYPNLKWGETIWNRDALVRYYAPWREVQARNVHVHIGECGCYSKTPNKAAMRWFKDLFSIYKDFGWGFALWNFEGPFGIIGHNRPGAVFENYHGYSVDRALVELLMSSRVSKPKDSRVR
jgi:hypothetical protein